MRCLSSPFGAIPRAFKNHRTPEGFAYRVYLTGILARLGPLPADASPTLREAGRLTIELEAIGLELGEARRRKRRRDVSRLRRQMVPMRTQLLTLERRLEELAASRPVTTFADAVRAAAQQSNSSGEHA